MNTLRRYVWREVAASTGFVLLALVALFAMFDLIKEFDDVGHAGYRPAHALAFVALLMPSRTYELMPIAALIGTIYALSKLAANSEFTIMRVAGLTTQRLAITIVLATLGNVALNAPLLVAAPFLASAFGRTLGLGLMYGAHAACSLPATSSKLPPGSTFSPGFVFCSASMNCQCCGKVKKLTA